MVEIIILNPNGSFNVYAEKIFFFRLIIYLKISLMITFPNSYA
jgi:hypothetical protein